LRSRGVLQVGPGAGDLACGETGEGRMAEPDEILAAIEAFFSPHRPLEGRRALVTSGPTHEPIDPVRFIGNRSSGKQGHAVAAALAALGADTTLVTGPVAIPDPPGATVVRVETAREMLAACEAALPVDVAVCAAAVADWRVGEESGRKIKKDGGGPPTLTLTENPDILATLSQREDARPVVVVGFAAETDDLEANALPSSRERAAASSWPTTSRRAPVPSAATRTRSCWCRATASRAGLPSTSGRSQNAWPHSWVSNR